MYVELGKIVGVWGVKGWVKLHSYTRHRADIAEYKKWWLQAKGSDEPRAIEVLNCREQGPGIVAQLLGVNDRDQAALLSGQRILVRQSDLPQLPEGEYYWQQLIGLQVSNTLGNALGVVDSILETGANDVLVVRRPDDGEDILVPYTDQVVSKVDLAAGCMLVDWDPSYLDD